MDRGAVRTPSPAALTQESVSTAPTAPLAVRIRPDSLDEVVGQQHLLRQGSPLRVLATGAGLGWLWGAYGAWILARAATLLARERSDAWLVTGAVLPTRTT